MKATVFCSMIALGIAPLATVAQEVSSSFSWGNVTFQPRVYMGYADYKLESSDFNFTLNGVPESRPIRLIEPEPVEIPTKIQFTGLLLGVGGSVAVGSFFGDFYYQSTSGAAFSPYVREEGVGFSRVVSDDVDAEHSDWAVSLGYRITDQWSVFAGYKSGTTEWDGSDRGLQASPPRVLSNTVFDGSFEQDGPFLGTSYSFLIGPGALTVKAGYAYLDGNYKFKTRGETVDGSEFFKEQLKAEGNSDAYSLGISWTQSWDDQLGFSIGVNYHNYKFDLSGSASGEQVLDSGSGPAATVQASGGRLTEELFTVAVSLLYTF